MADRSGRYVGDSYFVGIRSIGKYIPSRVVTNDELVDRLPTTDEWIKRSIGIDTRYFSAPGEWSSDLGARALLDACDQAGRGVSEVSLVICGTYTPDHMLPHTAAAIMHKAGIGDVPGFDINSGGCPGSVFALDVGTKYVASGEYPCVAVVLTDVSSKAFDPEDRTVGVIFGDAAACYLLEPTWRRSSIGRSLLRTDPSHYHTAYIAREQRVDADGSSKFSDFGSQFMTMQGREIKEFVLGTIPNFIKEFLSSMELEPDDVDFFAFHQANRNLIHGVLASLGQPLDKTMTNIERLGNTSGASLPLLLREAAESGRLRPGDLALLVAFGGGLNYGATLVRWCGPEDFERPS
jgi:3-oxoacyl-[acyl-carrier-protein] synthase III